MVKFTFDKCCFCIELRTGSFIIGYLQLVSALIGTVFLILGLIAGGVLTTVKVEDNSRFGHSDSSYNPYGQNRITAQETESLIKTTGVIIMVLSGILLIFVVIGLAFVITLVVGLHQNKSGHVKAYLIYGVIFLVIFIIMFFAGFAKKPISVSDVISNLLGILLNLYFLLVIRSYYYVMNDTSKGPAIYSAP